MRNQVSQSASQTFSNHELTEFYIDFVSACEEGDMAFVVDAVDYHPRLVMDQESFLWHCDEVPIIEAAKNNHADIVEFLLKCGFSPDIEDGYGDRAIMHASRHEGATILKCLVQSHHVCVNVYDSQMKTPLMFAARRGCLESTNILLDAGAIVSHIDGAGLSALDYALEGNNNELIALLLSHGAGIAHDFRQSRLRFDALGLDSLCLMFATVPEALITPDLVIYTSLDAFGVALESRVLNMTPVQTIHIYIACIHAVIRDYLNELVVYSQEAWVRDFSRISDLVHKSLKHDFDNNDFRMQSFCFRNDLLIKSVCEVFSTLLRRSEFESYIYYSASDELPIFSDEEYLVLKKSFYSLIRSYHDQDNGRRTGLPVLKFLHSFYEDLVMIKEIFYPLSLNYAVILSFLELGSKTLSLSDDQSKQLQHAVSALPDHVLCLFFSIASALQEDLFHVFFMSHEILSRLGAFNLSLSEREYYNILSARLSKQHEATGSQGLFAARVRSKILSAVADYDQAAPSSGPL